MNGDLVHYPPPPRPVPLGLQVRRYVRALLARRPTAAFLILAQGRTGSTLLTDLLASVPGVVCEREILADPVRVPRWWVEGHRARSDGDAYGFKVKIYQLTRHQGIADPGAWLRDLAASGWDVVYLRRENLVRQVLSNARLWRTGVTHRTTDTPAPREPLRVDVDRLVAYLDARRRNLEAEQRALRGIDHLRLTYEDDLLPSERHVATVQRVLAHVGLDAAAAPTTELRRTSTDDLAAVIANLEEVAAALRGTPYEHMLR